MTGFAIAGIDGKYHWAEAEICGNEIIVSSEMVKHPWLFAMDGEIILHVT